MSWNNQSKMILCGDFNIDVSSDPSLTSSLSPNYLLTQLSSDFGLSQVVSEPTRITNSRSSTIDLVFLSTPELLSSIAVLTPVGSSDHNSISVSLKLPPVTIPPITPPKLFGITKRPMSVLLKNS